MTKVWLVCPARTVLWIMVSHFSANTLSDVVSTFLPQVPELPVQWEMLLVLHWWQDLPCALAESLAETEYSLSSAKQRTLSTAKGRLSSSAVCLPFSFCPSFALPEGKGLISFLRAQTRHISHIGSRLEQFGEQSSGPLLKECSSSCRWAPSTVLSSLAHDGLVREGNNSVPVTKNIKYFMSKVPNAVALEGSQLFPWNQLFCSSCHLHRWAGNWEGCDPAQQVGILVSSSVNRESANLLYSKHGNWLGF